MLSPRLKAAIDNLWNRFWSGGIANPLTAIEQITYLVFLKRLEDLDREREIEARRTRRDYTSIYAISGGETYRWSYIRQLPAEERLTHIQTRVFEWMRNLADAGDRMRDAVFVIPNANLLQGAVEIIDSLIVSAPEADTLGEIYEMLLSEIAEAGKNGQFRTPRHIIRTMCDLIDPQFGETICDPACGTAGFLVNAYQHILKENTSRESLQFQADGTPLNLYGDQLTQQQFQELRRNHFYGFDFDRTMVRLGWMNMKLHGMDDPQIHYADTLGSSFYDRIIHDKVGGYDAVLANPPFTGSIDRNDIGFGLQSLGTAKTELLFLELILELLQVGGRAAVIVPEGVLFGSSSAHRILRRKLVVENQLDAVISLPAGVFQPYTGVKTSILLFNKGGHTDEVWFYDVGADGFTLNAKRDPDPQRNDLWDLVTKYRLRFHRPAPAFVHEATWGILSNNLLAEEPSQRYIQPIITDKFVEVEDEATPMIGQTAIFAEPESMKIAVLKEFRIEELANPKDWIVPIARLEASDYRLDAGFYKPQISSAVQYDPPQQIIDELLGMEDQIKERLGRLLRMVEGAK